MADLMSTGISGLLAFRSALTATGHNIANVNTPGYSRQSVLLASRVAGDAGGLALGNGVSVVNTQRSYSQFVADEIRSSMISVGRMESFAALATRMDGLLGDTSNGVGPGLQDFFDSIQVVADDPASLPARDVLLSNASAMVSRFNDLSASYDRVESEVNLRISDSVQNVNRLAESIAQINGKIVLARGANNRQLPNDLLDQREVLVQELAGHIGVTTNEQSDGALNVFVGNGQTLVIGNQASELKTTPGLYNPLRLEVAYAGSSGNQSITNSLKGGALGGSLDFRREMLDPARSELGLVATGLAQSFNDQHRSGMDLNGQLGGDLFAIGPPASRPSSANTGAGTVTTSIADVSQLTGSEYTLTYDGASYLLTSNSTGQLVPMAGSGTVADPFTAEGLEIVAGGAAAGDRFRLQPTAGAADSLELVLTDAASFAAASPVITSTGTSNTGNGTISGGRIVDSTDPGLLTTSTIQFTGPATYSVNGAGAFAYADGDPVLINGVEFTLKGTPSVGDSFTLKSNSGGIGDNRNALAMGPLATTGVLNNGNTGLQNGFGQQVARVGATTQRVTNSAEASQLLLKNAYSTQSSVSGVNLDEEATRLLQYQQSYDAAAQIIAVADSLFQSLLGAVRR